MTPDRSRDPLRPEPRQSVVAVAHGWLGWFGTGRLVASALAVLVLAGGAAWLLTDPPPAAEARLPTASAGAPAVTLPAPSSAPSSAPQSTLVAGPIVVHVAGAVVVPGVYQLPPGARVADAVAAGGGPSPDAELDGVNLAATLVDAQRIYVPRVGEVDPLEVAIAPGSALAPGNTAAGGAEPADAGPVDLNRASVEELDTLPGIGPALAAAIIDDRSRNGPFASVDDLDRVAGIGPAKLAVLRGLVTA